VLVGVPTPQHRIARTKHPSTLTQNRAPSERSLLAWVVTPEWSRRRNDHIAFLRATHTAPRPQKSYQAPCDPQNLQTLYKQLSYSLISKQFSARRLGKIAAEASCFERFAVKSLNGIRYRSTFSNFRRLSTLPVKSMKVLFQQSP